MTQTKPWIQNCAASDILAGKFHSVPDDNTILIQIVDPGSEFPLSPHSFKEIHQFEFLDIEKDDYVFDEEMRCSDDQAAKLVQILVNAKQSNSSILVHCTAGICRSGAVTEVGVMMGFEDTGTYRQPNLMVKHKMMSVLGIHYNENEESAPVNLGAKFGWEK